MLVSFDTSSIDDYRKFLALKSVPSYSWSGLRAVVPDEYAAMVTGDVRRASVDVEYDPSPFCFDYQAGIASLAIRKKKYAAFVDCGYGKTIIGLEFAKHAIRASGKKMMWVSPLMVCEQTVSECKRFYGDRIAVEQIAAADLQSWMNSPGECLGVTNYEAIRDDIRPGKIGGIILDESSYLKSHYGAWGTRLIEIGRGVEWKLAMTGTPAPNDRIEYANHAVFCDQVRTTNEFLAKYFVNKGQTQERWVIKPHALRPFYRDMSSWCIFMTDPTVYGWKDNAEAIPPIHVHLEQVPLTPQQRQSVSTLTGGLFVREAGGIGQRSQLMRIAKGYDGCPTNKPQYIYDRVASWPDESTIIWCHFNDEQDMMEKTFSAAASIRGSTPIERRRELIEAFKAGDIKTMISKPKVLGFGLNLQVATRQVFNGMNDSYEDFYQAVKRSNRVGSTRPLNVHVPLTEIEEPMVSNVLRKAGRVESDAKEQEALFLQYGIRQ